MVIVSTVLQGSANELFETFQYAIAQKVNVDLFLACATYSFFTFISNTLHHVVASESAQILQQVVTKKTNRRVKF